MMSGLMDLNFGDPVPEEPKQDSIKSRAEEVKEFFNNEDKKRQKWDEAHEKL
jgi:hypothetical protein